MLNYLGIVFDFNTVGNWKVYKNKFIGDLLEENNGSNGTVKTPVDEGLFGID